MLYANVPIRVPTFARTFDKILHANVRTSVGIFARTYRDFLRAICASPFSRAWSMMSYPNRRKYSEMP